MLSLVHAWIIVLIQLSIARDRTRNLITKGQTQFLLQLSISVVPVLVVVQILLALLGLQQQLELPDTDLLLYGYKIRHMLKNESDLK